MSRFRSTIGLAALATVAGLAAGCGSSSPSAPTVAADVTISMVGDRGSQSYAPNPTTMRVGQTVAWKNNDTHRARRNAGRVAVRNRHDQRRRDERAADDEHRRHVHVSLHDPPGMVGTLVVQ